LKGIIENAPKRLQLEDIQGNCLGGFNKDCQAMLFVRFTNTCQAQETLRTVFLPDVQASSSLRVVQFNNQFRALHRHGVPEGTIIATWTNLILTFSGLQKLNPGLDETAFPAAFREGMRARAEHLSDVCDNAPEHWDRIVDWAGIDAVAIIASDDCTQISPTKHGARVKTYLDAIAAQDSGLALCVTDDHGPTTEFQGPGQIYGHSRECDQRGHEHFGFKDSISQPGVRGVDAPDDPLTNPDQGHPGQDLLHPGEFVIGYPRQKPTAKPGHDGPNPDPGLISGSGDYYGAPTGGNDAIDPPGSRVTLPAWALNGSFVVFRRLEQDVPGFNRFIKTTAAALGLSEDLFGAKMVGRFKSGAPLETLEFPTPHSGGGPKRADPGTARPPLAEDPVLVNNFEYGDDDGDDPRRLIVPRAAHIRKVYPRDQVPHHEFALPPANAQDDAESRTQTHRILRRGIPYGASLGTEGEAGQPDAPRGLLFLCYQSDLERQFEFVQKHWVNDRNFPREATGVDALISTRPPGSAGDPMAGCPFHPNGDETACPVTIQRFIRTRGGEYFFSPSLTALANMLNPDHKEPSMPRTTTKTMVATLTGWGLPLRIANDNYHFDAKDFAQILGSFQSEISKMVAALDEYVKKREADPKIKEIFGLSLCFDFPQIGIDITDSNDETGEGYDKNRRQLCMKFYCNGGGGG
jgi:Dyp-type peroxidase family